MDPYEEERKVTDRRLSAVPPSILETWARLQLIASAKLHKRHGETLPEPTRRRRPSRIATFVRRLPRLPRPVVAAIGLAALIAAAISGSKWFKRNK